MNNEELQCMWFVKGAWGAVCRQISFLIFGFVWEQGLIFNIPGVWGVGARRNHPKKPNGRTRIYTGNWYYYTGIPVASALSLTS